MCTNKGGHSPPKVFELQRDTLSLHFQRLFHWYMLRLLIIFSFPQVRGMEMEGVREELMKREVPHTV